MATGTATGTGSPANGHRVPRARGSLAHPPPLPVGLLATGMLVVAAQRFNASLAVELLVGLGFFTALVVFVLQRPPVAVALIVPYFAALPAVKVLAFAPAGPTKDAIVFATAVAAGIRAQQRRAA